ncbi:MAG: hypothetical protein ACRD6W_17880, partial [Nitrososphaerales archaeon]
IDFVELDPYRDVAEITTRTVNTAILTFMAGHFLKLHDGWRGYDTTPILPEAVAEDTPRTSDSSGQTGSVARTTGGKS